MDVGRLAEGGRAVKVVQAYRFALDPTPSQERSLRSHAGAARFAWNWGLARCQERYQAEQKWYSAAELHKLWNAEKKADPGLSWWAENSKCAYQEAFRNLDRAMRDYVNSGKGERKGKRLGFPRFKKRGRCRDSFRLTGAIRCGGAAVALPRLGALKTHEPTVKLARKAAAGEPAEAATRVARALPEAARVGGAAQERRAAGPGPRPRRRRPRRRAAQGDDRAGGPVRDGGRGGPERHGDDR